MAARLASKLASPLAWTALAAATLVGAPSASAMPPRPSSVRPEAPSGLTDVKVRRITKVQALSTTAPPPRVALRGARRMLVILVETDDSPWPAAYTKGRYEELLFDKSTSSLREYFRENSYGLFDLTGEVVGPVKVPGRLQDYAYGRGTPSGDAVRRMITLALGEAAKRVDLARFDTHDAHGEAKRDGVLDHVLVIYAEKSGAPDGFAPIWPHRGSSDIELPGGLRAASYLTVPHAARLGVYVHELGHDLGLPDLYDRDESSHGAGDWCTMASGSWLGDAERPVHLSAWAKMRLGWIIPQVVAAPKRHLEIPSASERPFALKIPLGEVDSPEYLILENRRRVGFDALLPAEGLLVWHIDEKKGDNDDERHKLADVVEATEDQDLDRWVAGASPEYEADLFDGRTRRLLSDDTRPSTRTHDGKPSGVRIQVLTPPERVMAVDVDRPSIFYPGGVPYTLIRDGYTFGRFSIIPLGKGGEALVPLEATPGGFLAFAAEAFVSGRPGAKGQLTFRVYADQKEKPGKVLAQVKVKTTVPREGYGWARGRLGQKTKGVRLAAGQRVWVGVTSEDGVVWPAANPFSSSGEARWRRKATAKALEDSFNFKEGVARASDWVIRLGGFGYLEGDALPEPMASEADPLVQRLVAADRDADQGKREVALAAYETIREAMEAEPRRYEPWIPVAVNSAGVMAYELGRWELALERFEASLRRAVAASDGPNTADIHENLAETAFAAGRLERAVTEAEASRAINVALGRADRLVENLYWLGRAHQALGAEEAAAGRLREAKALLARAFPKDADAEAEWEKRIGAALAGEPEDRPGVKARGEDKPGRQRATHTDLLQFLGEDAVAP